MSREMVTFLGGPKHGDRMLVDQFMYEIRTVQPPPMRYWLDNNTGITTEIPTISYRLKRFPIGYRTVTVAIHPDITDATADRLTADLVTAAWEREGAK